jgi:hypothetical protein
MSTSESENFYFVRHPAYDSFALIQVEGELPEVIPEKVLRLMPGNGQGAHKGVVVEQDQTYLENSVRTEKSLCFPWFEHLENRKWETAGGLTYREVGSFLMM